MTWIVLQLVFDFVVVIALYYFGRFLDQNKSCQGPTLLSICFVLLLLLWGISFGFRIGVFK